MKAYRMHVLLCAGTNCVSNKAFEIKAALESEIKKRGLEDEVLVVPTGCDGFCAVGPIMIVQPEGIFYQRLKLADIPYLVEEHFLKGRPVSALMYTPPKEKIPIPLMKDIIFFKDQRLIALHNRGMIDPENINDYIGRDGYKALAKVLGSMTPEEVIEKIKTSGLRGRGGGGFPTSKKWELCRDSESTQKYIICNADEGDPGAFMDRSIIEADPHAIIEGMTIGAYAIGGSSGYVYTRTEYPLAIERLDKAISDARDYGLLGENIFDSGFSFDIEIFRGAGAFVCGEETSLIHSIEGEPGEPRQRPPFPVQKGLFGNPTVINNVETWACVPMILYLGAEWFASIGTEKSKGTKVFSLAGKINNSGLVEVPMGITLREMVFKIGGGIPKGKKFKAVQIGGPSGGVIPESMLDLPIDYERIQEAGAIMGSGGMVVMDEEVCMVDVARYFIEFTRDESCGKCSSCREGLDAMYEILTNICKGEGKEGDIEFLEELGEAIINASMCGLGKSAPNPVLTSIRHFRDEYVAHIRNKKCPARSCVDLIEYSIDQEKCTGCFICNVNCPTNAIVGEKKKPQTIDKSKCIKCTVCLEVCRFDAIKVG